MSARVYIGKLAYGVGEPDIQEFFRKSGKINEIVMKNGFAFVYFDDYRDASDAVYELNGKYLLGERVYVEKAKGNPRGADKWRGYGKHSLSRRRSRDTCGYPARTKHRLIVENLSTRVSWQDLKDYMRQAGEVAYASAHQLRRNEGVVEFVSDSDLQNAIKKLDDSNLIGRRIRLVEDGRREGDSGDGGAGRRSRSSSSRSRFSPRTYSSRIRSRSCRRSRSSSTRSRSRTRFRSSRSRSRACSRSLTRSHRRRSSSDSRSRSTFTQSHSHHASRGRSKSKSPVHSKTRSRFRSRSRSRSEIKRSKSRFLSKVKKGTN